MSMNAQEQKKALRRAVLAARDALDAATLAEKSTAIFNAVCALPEYQAARLIFSYGTFGSELHTYPFMERILAEGKGLVMSRMDRASRTLALYQVENLDTDLVPGPWDIREPDPARCTRVEPAALDFILMPGSVFDRKGGRMGYGAGFYDRLLSALHPLPPLVAPALDLQVVPEVPMEPHDIPMDLIVTESTIYRILRKE